MALLPQLADVKLDIVQLANSSSTFFTPAQVFGWAQLVADHLADPAVTGVVVAHGTDTMEESAYLFDLVIEGSKPVAFTGAMRPGSDVLSDGPRNLECARLVAASPVAQGLGVVIVMAEQVHAARDATKVHPASIGAFISPNAGPLGMISRDSSGDGLEIHRRPACREHIDTDRIVPEVEYVKTVLGSDSALIDAAVDRGARGIVIEAFGGGEVTPYMADGIERARQHGVEVVVATRCLTGRPSDRYADVGEGQWLAGRGVRFAGVLSGPKARVKLMLALGAGTAQSLDSAFPG